MRERIRKAVGTVAAARGRVAKPAALLSMLSALLVALFVAFAITMLSKEPEWAFWLLGVAGERAKLTVLEFFGIAMGGVVLAIQAVTAHRRAVAMEDTAREQANAVLKTEQGQRQERLKSGIEHLGQESSQMMEIGGAYELFHLAQDDKAFRKTVIDMLSAYIRTNTEKPEYRAEGESEPPLGIQHLLRLLAEKEREEVNDVPG